MAKLTDSQLIVLSAAAAREDGAAAVPAKMNKAAAAKVGSSLVIRKLMREVKAKAGMPVWRKDDDGRVISLIITKAGKAAIGVEETSATDAASTGRTSVGSKRSRSVEVVHIEKRGAASEAVQSPRAGSKQAIVVGMLSEKSGATLDALIKATGWLPHTTRAALTGLRKRGFAIERAREGEQSVYRIVGTSAAAA